MCSQESPRTPFPGSWSLPFAQTGSFSWDVLSNLDFPLGSGPSLEISAHCLVLSAPGHLKLEPPTFPREPQPPTLMALVPNRPITLLQGVGLDIVRAADLLLSFADTFSLRFPVPGTCQPFQQRTLGTQMMSSYPGLPYPKELSLVGK